MKKLQEQHKENSIRYRHTQHESVVRASGRVVFPSWLFSNLTLSSKTKMVSIFFKLDINV